MAYYQKQGTVPAKRFTALRDPQGRLYYEELITSAGFNGPSALLYHRNRPTQVERVVPASAPNVEPWDPTVVRNHLLVADRVKGSGDELEARVPLLFNDDLVYSISRPTGAGDRFYRNAFADELLVVVEGSGTLETVFGEFGYSPLDLVVIPRGITWRLRPDDISHTLLVLETAGALAPPERARNSAGQLLARSTYSERDMRTPVLEPVRDEAGEWEVAVKTGPIVTTYVMPHHPLDVVGWDGALYPYAVNLADLEPLSGRVHLMPDMHQVFGAPGAVICAITPGRTPDHPDIYPAQSDHSADCDEIFYRFATDGPAVPGVGTITVHTRAVAHGPKPGFEDKAMPERTHVYGVIMDVARPVTLTAAAHEADDATYVRAWL